MNHSFDVGIAGELNLDLILYGLPQTMQTERELLASDFSMTLGSSSAIVAHNLAALGMQVSFQSVIGDDDLGTAAERYLADRGVDVTGVKKLPGRKTGVTVLLPHDGERHILTYLGTIADLALADVDVSHLCSARHFHLSSLYLQSKLHAGLPAFLAGLKRNGMTISLDPNDDPADVWGSPLMEVLPFVDIFMPNASELCRMTKSEDVTGALEQIQPHVATIVLKRGSLGALVVTEGTSYESAPVKLAKIVDTVGAGDSFNAGFLAAFLSGRDVATAARCGNLSGALSTQGRGGIEAFVRAEIRDPFLQAYDPEGLLNFAR
ncbi:carbohydrate kinase family protein [Terriglobus sp. 2YAB30_2]|uniref:carbohydrate kinase family protein n=1 Tax=unclassified Terriglobus TaxID=2628988 RepID=UPI003F9B853F